MRNLGAAILALFVFAAGPGQTQEPDRNTLYMVTTLRAAPGELAAMIEDLQGLASAGYYEMADRRIPWILRHSQGDHWDLMLVEPVGSYPAFFSEARMNAATQAAAAHGETLSNINARTAFREEVFAWGASPDILGEGFDTAGLYHIEMFNALPGRLDELVQQREMENAYLSATGQVPNWVFVSSIGSDVDTFTIGTHTSLQSFAATPDLPAETFEEAARDAGFESRGTIGFYLRSLISGHNDTLAVPVRD